MLNLKLVQVYQNTTGISCTEKRVLPNRVDMHMSLAPLSHFSMLTLYNPELSLAITCFLLCYPRHILHALQQVHHVGLRQSMSPG